MPTLPPILDFVRNPDASPKRMQQAMLTIWTAILALQAPRKSLDDELALYQAIGLERVNDAVLPVYEALKAVVSLGVLTNATSTTAIKIQTGRCVFTLSDADRDRYAYTGFIQAVSGADSRNALLGRFAAYDRETGRLTVDVFVASGDVAASPADWHIMPGSAPFLPASVLSSGGAGAPLQAVPYSPVLPDLTLETVLTVLQSLSSTPPTEPGVLWLNNGRPEISQ